MRESDDGRLRVVYRLVLADGESAEARARGIALEQTVELPRAAVPDLVAERAVGRVEAVEELGEGRARVVVSYPREIAGPGFGQLVNLLFGNISLQSGIRIERVGWPRRLLADLPGPALGVRGIRARCRVVVRRPLLCAALKPLGAGVEELAERCRRLALGRVDIVKDDHSLADQPIAPFRERVVRCLDAVARANRFTGGHTRYFPHLAGGAGDLPHRVEWLRSRGVRGVMVSPLHLGWETVSWLARHSELAVLAHPSATGAFFGADHGIAPPVLLGDLFRMMGCDGVIYPNVGGRFRFDLATCEAINRALRGPLGELRPAFPVPGGGIDRSRVPLWIERYGPDTIFLLGSTLYGAPDLEEAVRGLMEVLNR